MVAQPSPFFLRRRSPTPEAGRSLSRRQIERLGCLERPPPGADEGAHERRIGGQPTVSDFAKVTLQAGAFRAAAASRRPPGIGTSRALGNTPEGRP